MKKLIFALLFLSSCNPYMMGFRYYYGQEIEIELGDSVYVGTILTFPNRLGRMEVKINDSVYLIKRKNLIEDE